MDTQPVIERYNRAWNDHDLRAITDLHAADMVFENHTAGERAVGDAVADHVARIFEAWPDLSFATRRLLAASGFAVCEWTASAMHQRTLRRGDLTAEPTGRRLRWRGVDVFTVQDGLIGRKDVYSDSMAIMLGAGLLSPTGSATGPAISSS